MHPSAITTGTEPFGLSPEDEGEEEEDDYYEATAERHVIQKYRLRWQGPVSCAQTSNYGLTPTSDRQSTCKLHRRNGVLPALFGLVNQIPASAGKDYPLHNPNAFAGGQIKNEIELNDFE